MPTLYEILLDAANFAAYHMHSPLNMLPFCQLLNVTLCMLKFFGINTYGFGA